MKHLPPVILFFDGACEDGPSGTLDVGIGGVLLDSMVKAFRYFGGKVPPGLVRLWQSDGSKQVIGQAELIPIVLGRRAWADRLANRLLLRFIDNEAARSGMVRGYSPNRHSAAIIEAAILEEIVFCFLLLVFLSAV